ncbi:hypothetical protein [Micromonospora sp. WMMD1082]|uniref:hypothetical protein n=1 Tax=Micromonospora sp. WMMD1082 TaxID=3016104 RepID=UPI0024165271|nr:hypothetical protein [Micromonospora sp. WMMD1082]MDG4795093.1 hypothetical protein [Micromonospora sp. WMMD1082]
MNTQQRIRYRLADVIDAADLTEVGDCVGWTIRRTGNPEGGFRRILTSEVHGALDRVAAELRAHAAAPSWWARRCLPADGLEPRPGRAVYATPPRGATTAMAWHWEAALNAHLGADDTPQPPTWTT